MSLNTRSDVDVHPAHGGALTRKDRTMKRTLNGHNGHNGHTRIVAIPAHLTAAALGADLLRGAVARYRAAREALRDAHERYGRAYDALQAMGIATSGHGAPGLEACRAWEVWLNLADDVADDAERHLIACVMIACGRVGWCEEPDLREPCGVTLDGHLYIIAPREPDDDRGPVLTVIGHDSIAAGDDQPIALRL